MRMSLYMEKSIDNIYIMESNTLPFIRNNKITIHYLHFAKYKDFIII